MKEEPAWRRELRDVVAPWVPYETKQPDDPDEYPEGLMATLLPYIKAAEQRGFSAGVSKSGDKVAELRKQLKTAKADARQEALTERLNGLKADWARFRSKVLAETWEAMRDAEGGPLIDAMGVINGLLDKS